jgi:hypothetical protein
MIWTVQFTELSLKAEWKQQAKFIWSKWCFLDGELPKAPSSLAPLFFEMGKQKQYSSYNPLSS